MTREEAIKNVKMFFEGMGISLSNVTKESFNTLIPELAESEDEQALRIIKKRMCYDPVPISDEDRRIVENYLEKQKESLHISETCKENADSFTDEDERIRQELIDFLIVDEKSFDIKSPTIKKIRKFLAWLEKQKEQKPLVPKPHKGDDGNPYDMCVSDAQDYAIKRGFGIPFNDGEVYVDARHITQTIGNILRWADEHPKEQKPSIFPPGLGEVHWNPIPSGKDVYKWNLPEDFEEAVYKVANFISPFDSQEELRKVSHRFAEQLLDIAKREQKPAEWSEEDDWKRKELIQYLEEKGDYRTVWMTWLKSLRPVKQEWSEEEKGILLECISALQNSSNWLLSDKLSSLRPQPKSVWSKDDEECIKTIEIALGTSKTVSHDSYLRTMDFLKSLRPQNLPTWERDIPETHDPYTWFVRNGYRISIDDLWKKLPKKEGED